MPILGELASLKEVNLDDTGITDKGLQNLEALPELEILHIRNTGITEKGVKRLRPSVFCIR
jgi:Leucine Rich repeat